MSYQSLRIGPEYRHWLIKEWPGSCEQCGGDCDGDDCGLHAAGCQYGGFTDDSAYWLIADGCELYHGECDFERLCRWCGRPPVLVEGPDGEE